MTTSSKIQERSKQNRPKTASYLQQKEELESERRGRYELATEERQYELSEEDEIREMSARENLELGGEDEIREIFARANLDAMFTSPRQKLRGGEHS